MCFGKQAPSHPIPEHGMGSRTTGYIARRLAGAVCIRGGPQVQAFLRERRFHLVASASTLFRRLAASIAAGS
ncbi:hypothetical protein CN207_07605 [Sinorhizobium meliloti]|nr:hypothetical protein CN207_07605 [Sinorhizobium meliloti]